MGKAYRPQDIFRPKAYPEYTFVDRKSGKSTYSKKLKLALEIPGNLVIISGASKSGKTVLCHRTIPRDKAVDIDGSQINTQEKFWSVLAEKIDASSEVQFVSNSQETTGKNTSLNGGIKIPIVNAGAGRVVTETQSAGHGMTTKLVQSHSDIMNYLMENDLVLIIDDFHYIPNDVQQYIARTLKTEIFYGLKAIILTLPHRSDDAIRANPDLIGRTTTIDIQRWTKDELAKIAETGFSLLGLKVSQDAMDNLVQESIWSPQLMQGNCLGAAINATEEKKKIIELEDLENAYRDIAETYTVYQYAISEALRGPAQGKNKRTKHETKDGKKVDIYHALLLCVIANPPQLELPMDEIKARMKRLFNDGEAIPSNLTIINSVKHIEHIIHESLAQMETVEWKDKCLYILDPILLFYLRWNDGWKD